MAYGSASLARKSDLRTPQEAIQHESQAIRGNSRRCEQKRSQVMDDCLIRPLLAKRRLCLTILQRLGPAGHNKIHNGRGQIRA